MFQTQMVFCAYFLCQRCCCCHFVAVAGAAVALCSVGSADVAGAADITAVVAAFHASSEVNIAAADASNEAAAAVAASYVALSPLLLMLSPVSDVSVLFNGDALTPDTAVAAALVEVVAVAAVVAATATAGIAKAAASDVTDAVDVISVAITAAKRLNTYINEY